MGFVAEVLGRRSGLPGPSARDQLLSGDTKRIIALLKIAGCSRALAASLLAGIGDLIGIDDAGAAIALFDKMPKAAVASARAWLGTAVEYRDALDALEPQRG